MNIAIEKRLIGFVCMYLKIYSYHSKKKDVEN